jgi:hypothetical protein
MSKQLKFKFKKTLKKAEFVHADLEYHQQLVSEAKKLFSEEVRRLVEKLSAEDQALLQEESERRNVARVEAAERASKQTEGLKQLEEKIQIPPPEEACTSLVTTTHPVEEADPEDEKQKTKSTELKKLFHRIAEQTHPDKVCASGFSDKEVYRLEKVFKRALTAYENNNWYILYSIAADLDLKTQTPTQEHIEWIEDDVRNTMGAIAQIGNLLAWVWYTGTPVKKQLALKDYFRQVYNFNYPDL